MSDALLDIRKADRNRPKYSEIEYENAILDARTKMAQELSTIIQKEWQCDLAEVLYIIDCISKGNNEPFKQTPNFLVACNKANHHCGCCDHRGLHKITPECGKRLCDGVTECVESDKPFNVGEGLNLSGCI